LFRQVSGNWNSWQPWISMSKRGGPPSVLPVGNQDRWRPIVCTLTRKTENETRLDSESSELTESITITRSNYPLAPEVAMSTSSSCDPFRAGSSVRSRTSQTSFPCWRVGEGIVQHVYVLAHECAMVDLVCHLASQIKHQF
jgi:hypothetical protein